METMTERKNRRQLPRVHLPCDVRFLRIPKVAKEYRKATVQDISKDGVRFHAHEEFPRKSCFLLDVFLPGTGPSRSLATVAWVKPMPDAGGYQIGGKFVEPNLDVELALAHLNTVR